MGVWSTNSVQNRQSKKKASLIVTSVHFLDERSGGQYIRGMIFHLLHIGINMKHSTALVSMLLISLCLAGCIENENSINEAAFKFVRFCSADPMYTSVLSLKDGIDVGSHIFLKCKFIIEITCYFRIAWMGSLIFGDEKLHEHYLVVMRLVQ